MNIYWQDFSVSSCIVVIYYSVDQSPDPESQGDAIITCTPYLCTPDNKHIEWHPWLRAANARKSNIALRSL